MELLLLFLDFLLFRHAAWQATLLVHVILAVVVGGVLLVAARLGYFGPDRPAAVEEEVQA